MKAKVEQEEHSRPLLIWVLPLSFDTSMPFDVELTEENTSILLFLLSTQDFFLFSFVR